MNNNFTYLQPKDKNEMADKLRHLTPEEVYNVWKRVDLTNIEHEAMAYEELLGRASSEAKNVAKRIREFPWYEEKYLVWKLESK